MGGILGKYWGPSSHIEMTNQIEYGGVITFSLIYSFLVAKYKSERYTINRK